MCSHCEFEWNCIEGMEFIRGAMLCSVPQHLHEAADVIDEWLLQRKCTTRQRKKILNCLDLEYLRQLPVVGKSRPWPKTPLNRNFRYHFRAQTSRVLGWRERTTFPEHIDSLIRQLWPDNVVPIERQGGRESSCKDEIVLAKPSHATSGQKTNARIGEKKRSLDGRTGHSAGECATSAGDGSGSFGRHVGVTNATTDPIDDTNPIKSCCGTKTISAGKLPNSKRPRWYTISSMDESDQSTAASRGDSRAGNTHDESLFSDKCGFSSRDGAATIECSMWRKRNSSPSL